MRTLAQELKIVGDGSAGGFTLKGPAGLTFTNVGDIVTSAVTFVFAFAGLGLLIMLIMAGFTYMTSAGDSKKMEQGKQQLTYAILGFLIVFGAFGAVQILSTVFGITAFEIFK